MFLCHTRSRVDIDHIFLQTLFILVSVLPVMFSSQPHIKWSDFVFQTNHTALRKTCVDFEEVVFRICGKTKRKLNFRKRVIFFQREDTCFLLVMVVGIILTNTKNDWSYQQTNSIVGRVPACFFVWLVAVGAIFNSLSRRNRN